MKQLLKKSLLLIFALLLVVSLIACAGQEQSKGESDGKKASSKDMISFSIRYNGTTIELGKPAKKVLEALGEPLSSEEVFDCGEGNSRMQYQFSSFDLYTMKSGDEEVIDQIELYDDQSATSAKISIGSEESAVRDAYGKPTLEKDGEWMYTSGENNLIIEIDDGKVCAIGLLRKTK